MFTIYGISGQQFRGPLELMGQVDGVPGFRAGRAIAQEGDEPPPSFVSRLRAAGGNPGPPGEAAVQAYRETLQATHERGPLYHAWQVMTREVVTLGADDPVQTAWRTLMERGVHQAPVLDASKLLVGLVTERGLLTTFNLDGNLVRDILPRRVADVMATPVVSADPDTDIRLIARVMWQYGASGVPVVNEARTLLGFVTRGDILRAVIAEPPLSLWG